jgi:hypothetical protein
MKIIKTRRPGKTRFFWARGAGLDNIEIGLGNGATESNLTDESFQRRTTKCHWAEPGIASKAKPPYSTV